MITHIELTNFMSHAHTVIEPAAGLTVLVGPNNCGKSAVVAALQILAHNDNSTYVLRHGEKECSVQVTTDDGHTILWKRKSAPSYVIDDQKFDRLKGGGQPESLQPALRLPLVEGSGEDDFDVHFGAQKSPIFLLNSSPATAARFFASSSDASRLVAMQRKHKDKLAERQKEKNRLEAESKQLTAELETLQPAVDLDRQLKLAEQGYSDLLKLSVELELAAQAAAGLQAQQSAVGRCEAFAMSLAPLAPPPALTPTEPLAQLLGEIERGQASQEVASARAKSLAALNEPPALFDVATLWRTTEQLVMQSRAAERAEADREQLAALPVPPQLAETGPLAKLIEQLTAANVAANRWQSALQAAAPIAPPPQPSDIVPLREFATKLEAAINQIAACKLAQEAALAEMSATAEALRTAAEGEVCPTCGTPLDAQRLLESAASGLGGHAHA